MMLTTWSKEAQRPTLQAGEVSILHPRFSYRSLQKRPAFIHLQPLETGLEVHRVVKWNFDSSK